MSEDERRYSRDHLWMDAAGRVGVARPLLDALRGLDGVVLPALGVELRAGEAFGALEGHKGVVDLFSPCDGVVRAVHDILIREPSRLEADPDGAWLIDVEGRGVGLLDRAAYDALCVSARVWTRRRRR